MSSLQRVVAGRGQALREQRRPRRAGVPAVEEHGARGVRQAPQGIDRGAGDLPFAAGLRQGLHAVAGAQQARDPQPGPGAPLEHRGDADHAIVVVHDHDGQPRPGRGGVPPPGEHPGRRGVGLPPEHGQPIPIIEMGIELMRLGDDDGADHGDPHVRRAGGEVGDGRRHRRRGAERSAKSERRPNTPFTHGARVTLGSPGGRSRLPEEPLPCTDVRYGGGRARVHRDRPGGAADPDRSGRQQPDDDPAADLLLDPCRCWHHLGLPGGRQRRGRGRHARHARLVRTLQCRIGAGPPRRRDPAVVGGSPTARRPRRPARSDTLQHLEPPDRPAQHPRRPRRPHQPDRPRLQLGRHPRELGLGPAGRRRRRPPDRGGGERQRQRPAHGAGRRLLHVPRPAAVQPGRGEPGGHPAVHGQHPEPGHPADHGGARRSPP